MSTMRAASTILGLAVLLAACGGVPSARAAAQACAQNPTPVSPGGTALAAASRSFGLALTGQLAATAKRDVLTSPLSAEMALAMAATGARGATQRAMLDAMGLTGLPGDEVAREAGALMSRLQSSRCASIEIANSLWARRSFPLDPGYVSAVRSAFEGQARPLDAGSLKATNGWVSQATHGKIRSFMDSIPPDVMLYLINATYFHGAWQVPFDPARTRQAPFHRFGAADATVPLMDRTGEFVYGEGPGYQAVGLPYGGGAVRMVVVLPAATLPPSGFASFLDPARFQQITGTLEAGASGELQLPRFGLDYEASLLKPLRALGMAPAFQQGADFSGISPACPIGGSCYISDVTQKVRLEVDDQGTTAAAATRVAITVSLRVGGPFRMVVDRPFLAAVQDVETGTLLFVGVVGDPR